MLAAITHSGGIPAACPVDPACSSRDRRRMNPGPLKPAQPEVEHKPGKLTLPLMLGDQRVHPAASPCP